MSGSQSGVNPNKRVGFKKKERIPAVNKQGSGLKELWCKIRLNTTSGFVVSLKCLRIRLRKTQRREKKTGSASYFLNIAVCMKHLL